MKGIRLGLFLAAMAFAGYLLGGPLMEDYRLQQAKEARIVELQAEYEAEQAAKVGKPDLSEWITIQSWPPKP